MVGIMAAVFGMIWKCTSNIDESRLEKKEREVKLEEGSCEFDAVDLTEMKIDNNGILINTIEKLAYLRTYYPEPLSHILDKDSLHRDQKVRISNTEVTLSVYGDFIRMTRIGLDLSSEFQLNIPDKKPMNCRYTIGDFRADYPQSYKCRETFMYTAKTENVIVRLDNMDAGSELEFILLYFNFTEQLYQVELFYGR